MSKKPIDMTAETENELAICGNSPAGDHIGTGLAYERMKMSKTLLMNWEMSSLTM